jgi:Type IV Pilus-assembly protein W
VNYVLAGNVVHYKIQDDAQGLPNLMRSENGGPFQVLARGIEDLQVQYVRSDGTVSDPAPTVVLNDYTSLITQVRVQLFARAINTRIQGAVTTTDTSITHAQGTALRGAMSAQASPRQALWVLTQESPAPVTPRWN